MCWDILWSKLRVLRIQFWTCLISDLWSGRCRHNGSHVRWRQLFQWSDNSLKKYVLFTSGNLFTYRKRNRFWYANFFRDYFCTKRYKWKNCLFSWKRTLYDKKFLLPNAFKIINISDIDLNTVVGCGRLTVRGEFHCSTSCSDTASQGSSLAQTNLRFFFL